MRHNWFVLFYYRPGVEDHLCWLRREWRVWPGPRLSLGRPSTCWKTHVCVSGVFGVFTENFTNFSYLYIFFKQPREYTAFPVFTTCLSWYVPIMQHPSCFTSWHHWWVVVFFLSIKLEVRLYGRKWLLEPDWYIRWKITKKLKHRNDRIL